MTSILRYVGGVGSLFRGTQRSVRVLRIPARRSIRLGISNTESRLEGYCLKPYHRNILYSIASSRNEATFLDITLIGLRSR
jgi:hypothetical protein